MPERPPVASPARQNHFAKNMLLRAFSIPVSLCFPPSSQLSFSCHQNCVVLLTSIIHLPPPQYKYQVCFSHGVRNHPGLFLAACAATETTCHARCRDVSLSVSVSTCFSSCFSDAGSIAHFRGSWFVIRGSWFVVIRGWGLVIRGFVSAFRTVISPTGRRDERAGSPFYCVGRDKRAPSRSARPESAPSRRLEGGFPSQRPRGSAALPTRLAEDGSPYHRQDGGSPCGRVATCCDRNCGRSKLRPSRGGGLRADGDGPPRASVVSDVHHANTLRSKRFTLQTPA